MRINLPCNIPRPLPPLPPTPQTPQTHKQEKPSDQRIPSQQTTSPEEATPTSLAQGVRGAGPGESPSTLTDQEQGKSADVNAEQMGAPGEGAVADAVKSKANIGGGGEDPGLETDLDRKKAEQAPMREEMKEEQRREVDVGGILGQRGGPANPVS